MEPHAQTLAEAEMIAAILGGDTQLYHERIRPHERSVYMMALSFMKNEADAEDVAQEAFLKAFRNLSTFRAEAKESLASHVAGPEKPSHFHPAVQFPAYLLCG